MVCARRYYVYTVTALADMHPQKPIFQDEHGLAIKFFLQKDLSQETHGEICEMIAVRGFSSDFPLH